MSDDFNDFGPISELPFGGQCSSAWTYVFVLLCFIIMVFCCLSCSSVAKLISSYIASPIKTDQDKKSVDQ